MYIAPLYFGPNNDYDIQDAVNEAIFDGIDAGDIYHGFGRVYVVLNHIVVDEVYETY